ncbi:MAG TPA: MipA/OmpV family protein [Saliniramus sp.]|nr:MipA/OmpV family protein [Saliniramus sp.]
MQNLIPTKTAHGRVLLVAATVIGALALPHGANAQSIFAGDWTMTVGAQGQVVPLFEGSDSYRVRPMPIFAIRRTGSLARFKAPDDGLRIGIIDVENVRIGPVARLKGKRSESDSSALRGLGNVDYALELGLFAEIWATQNFRLSAELRHGIGGHKGIVADLGIDFVVRPESQWTLSAGPRMAWSNSSYMQTYFGVTPVQSANSGGRLAVYSPDGGVRSLGFIGSANYQVTPDWSLQAFARYDRLVGDARNSPIVRGNGGSANQFSAGLGVSYSFGINVP